MAPSTTLALVAGAVLVASTVSAQGFNFGHQSLVRTRLDAIVSPGQIAGHVHIFSGTSAISANMDFQTSRGADCTTSQIGEDMSGYWAPQLYYKWRNGSFSAIGDNGLITYWLDRGFAEGEVPPQLPDDFRMLAGDMNRDHYDETKASHTATSYECWGRGYGHSLPTIPTEIDCENFRPQIIFPNCWNGVDAFKPDNSHVAYPSGKDSNGGTCPPGFRRIPTLFIETYYTPGSTIGREYEFYPGCLVLANGDNHGLSFHADWLNGFPTGMLNRAFGTCTNNNLEFRQCPVWAPFENTRHGACRADGDTYIVNEPIGLDVPLAKLPGNNPVYNSSRYGNLPRRPDPNYVETAQMVRLADAQGGGCNGNQCSDYRGGGSPGPGGGGGGGAVTAPHTVSSRAAPVPSPTSATPAVGDDDATNTTGGASAPAEEPTGGQQPGGTGTGNAPGVASRTRTRTRTRPTETLAAAPENGGNSPAIPSPGATTPVVGGSCGRKTRRSRLFRGVEEAAMEQ